MSGEFSMVVKQQTMLLGLMKEVKLLQTLVKEKDAKINHWERQIDDLKQYTWMEDVLITGLEITHHSYASTARGGGDANTPAVELETLERQVLKFLENKKISIQSSSVAACHVLPRRDRNSKPAIIIRFVNRKHKVELMQQGKKLKGTGVFLNEHLTNRNADITRHAHMPKKQNKI